MKSIQKTYQIAVKCSNCGAGQAGTYFLDVPKGILIEDFLMNKRCKLCKCCTLEKTHYYRD
jgi:hypothetical protein